MIYCYLCVLYIWTPLYKEKRKFCSSVLTQYEIKQSQIAPIFLGRWKGDIRVSDRTLGHMGAGPLLCADHISPNQPSVIQLLPLEQKLEANVWICDLRSAEWNLWANTPLVCLWDPWRRAAGRVAVVSILACLSETEQNTVATYWSTSPFMALGLIIWISMSSRANEHKRVNRDSKYWGHCKWEDHIWRSNSPNSKVQWRIKVCCWCLLWHGRSLVLRGSSVGS